jgi:hypothetical protein
LSASTQLLAQANWIVDPIMDTSARAAFSFNRAPKKFADPSHNLR